MKTRIMLQDIVKHPFSRELAAVVALVALASVAAARWTSPVQWKPDSLLYQAHVYQVKAIHMRSPTKRCSPGP